MVDHRTLEARLLESIRAAGGRGVGGDELVRLAGDEAAAETALASLRSAGLAAPWRERWRAAESTGWLGGRVCESIAGGGARVATDRGDHAVGGDRLAGARAGDRVLLQPLTGRRRMVDKRSLPEAAVVAVLGERAGTAQAPPPKVERRTRERPEPAPSKTPAPSEPAAPSESIVGAVAGDGRARRLLPYDPREEELELTGASRVPEGEFVVAAIERPPTEERAGRARRIETLGDPEAPGVDAAVVLRHYRIPDRFPDAALAEAEGLPADPSADETRGRLDLRGQTVVTIDGADARDFDDALSIEPVEDLPGGGSGSGWRLGVHIADVSHYVAAGGALDREAERRGTSVYFPGRVVPMLPAGLSDGLCSLRPEVPRLTVSVFLDIDRRGKVHRRRCAETVIESARRLTYAEVRRLLEEERPRDAADYGPVLPLVHSLGELMAALNRRRNERGSLDFDLPEGNVELDTDGYTVGVQPAHRTVAHRIVEEAMIAANEAVASILFEARVPALYRVHDPPAPEDLETLARALERLGLEAPGAGGRVTPAELARVQRAAEGEPWQELVDSLLMRALKAAFYDPEPRGHFALASRRYTHFTSPIRRYPDLVVHRRLKALVTGGKRAAAEARPAGRRLEAIAVAASEAERRATRAERDLLQWKKVRFLASRVGERFPGRITGVQPFGLFVQLDRYLVDGLVPVRTLGREYFRFDAEGHRLVGERTGRSFRLADEVTVVLTGVSETHRGLDLELARGG